jgi:hypothetical protein
MTMTSTFASAQTQTASQIWIWSYQLPMFIIPTCARGWAGERERGDNISHMEREARLGGYKPSSYSTCTTCDGSRNFREHRLPHFGIAESSPA